MDLTLWSLDYYSFSKSAISSGAGAYALIGVLVMVSMKQLLLTYDMDYNFAHIQ